MGAASSVMMLEANLCESKRPIDGRDLLRSDGNEDRKKCLREVRYMRRLIKKLAEGQHQRCTRNQKRVTRPLIVRPSTMVHAEELLSDLKPERKLDFQMLGKLPSATRVTDLICRVALMLCLDETELPKWNAMTQEWLGNRPFNDVRFRRVTEAAHVWVSFDCALAAATALSALLPEEIETLKQPSSRAVAALFAWAEAVINSVLVHENNQEADPETSLSYEDIKEQIWSRAWSSSGMTKGRR